ncbi:hypothetical protein BDM02DRAFT_3183749 [Thelephora ganbajun]|uniref:Uncharacterized protein n=1 Tax=Thelephora ganbajun TaxID=370292 RepID=A0ACB6ZSS7_THEGA|nr:hypothetical protein BDM02DRAFT_3183749 [Thelephora ganbajun]
MYSDSSISTIRIRSGGDDGNYLRASVLRVSPDLNPDNVGHTSASAMQAFYTAIYEVGCLFGAFFALLYGNKVGRRRNMYIGACFVMVGAIIQITSIPGLTSGMFETKEQGLHICIEASMIAIGTVTAYWTDFGPSSIDSSLPWRLPVGLQIIFAALVVPGVYFLPESPRFLPSTGQGDEGQFIVAALMNQSVDSEFTQQEKWVIIEALKGDNPRIRDVLTGGPPQHLRSDQAIGVT